MLLGVDDRKDVYKGTKLVAERPAVDLAQVPDIDLTEREADSEVGASSRGLPDPAPALAPAEPAAIAIDEALLRRLRIPTEYHPPLLACGTLDDLIDATVPEDVRNQVFDLVSAPDFDQVLSQPSYVTGDVSDLLRFAEGELLGFLLQLDPEQEALVDWAMNGTGPTLVKGGPGTGKSTIALHRVRSLVASLRQAGTEPHVLFATYTNALVAGSRQQLSRILGSDAERVDVRTADSVAAELLDGDPEGRREIADHGALRAILSDAVALGASGRTPVQKRLMSGALDAIGQDYLLDEIEDVIQGREIANLDDYLVAQRAGRLLPLHAMQRRAVWQVSEAMTAQLTKANVTTWARRRRRAVELAREGNGRRYDAVVVDEAQDLQPTSLRLLMALCPQTNRFFLTADANQSIYGGSFRWGDVHEDLRFRGRTALLRRNYRSTREIGQAAQAYLSSGVLDGRISGERFLRSLGSEASHPSCRRDGERSGPAVAVPDRSVQGVAHGTGKLRGPGPDGGGRPKGGRAAQPKERPRDVHAGPSAGPREPGGEDRHPQVGEGTGVPDSRRGWVPRWGSAVGFPGRDRRGGTGGPRAGETNDVRRLHPGDASAASDPAGTKHGPLFRDFGSPLWNTGEIT